VNKLSGHNILLCLGLLLGLLTSSICFSAPSIFDGKDLRLNAEISEQDYQKAAEKMFKVREALTGKYSLADQITLGIYIMRYLSDLGTFEVPSKDIEALIKGIEDLSGEPFDPEFKQLLTQIERLRFSERRGQSYVKIFTKKDSGIRIPLTDMASPGSTAIPQFIQIENKAELFFRDLEGAKNDEWLKDFIKSKAKLLGLFKIAALNQVHAAIPKNISSYIKGSRPVASLFVEVEGIYARVKTKTLFKDIDFHLKKIVALPGIREGEEGVPPLVMEAKGKILRAKISIDR